MKKLFLTSFSFKTGENTYNEQRLVMVQSNEVPEGNDHESVAYTKMERWFPVNYPQSKLLSIIAHPTIIGYAEDTQIKNVHHPHILDGSWYSGNVIPKDLGEGFSLSFLIDPSGFRKKFVIGWYDHDAVQWMCDANEGVTLHANELVYQYLPFAGQTK